MSIKKTQKVRLICSAIVAAAIIATARIAATVHADVAEITTLVALLSMFVVDQVISAFGKDAEDIVEDIKPLIVNARDEIKNLVTGVEGKAAELQTHVARLLAHLETRWDHRRIGNRDKALRYVADQLRRESVQCVLNTDVRIQGHHAPYDQATLQVLRSAMKEWFGHSGATWTEVRGVGYDADCVAHIVAAVEDTKEQTGVMPNFVGHILAANSPVLNFTILEYSGGRKEVLFGWGRHERFPQDDVFACGDDLIVSAFSDLFTLLESSPWSTRVKDTKELLQVSAEPRYEVSSATLSGPADFGTPILRMRPAMRLFIQNHCSSGYSSTRKRGFSSEILT